MSKKESPPKEIIDVKDAKATLGEDGIDAIIKKDWSVADLPSEEELAKESHKSKMARTNKNSRANLVQYRKDTSPETKKKIVSKLKYKTKRKPLDLRKFFGDLIDEGALVFLEPVREILRDSNEELFFMGLMKSFLGDFPKDELSASDFDDLISLCTNRIIEVRLLKIAKTSDKAALDAASAIERLRKNSDKIKTNLASRRTDRIDTKNKQSFSIVDIAVEFDDSRRKELEERAHVLEEGQKLFLAGKKPKPSIDTDE